MQKNLVTDIRRIKEAGVRRIEAEADEKVAEAQRKLADAAAAANQANLPKRRDAVARAELELKRAEAVKTLAEANAVQMDAETRRLQAVEEAKIRFLEALSKLRQDGGDLLVDSVNLQEILLKGLPPSDDEDVEPGLVDED